MSVLKFFFDVGLNYIKSVIQRELKDSNPSILGVSFYFFYREHRGDSLVWSIHRKNISFQMPKEICFFGFIQGFL